MSRMGDVYIGYTEVISELRDSDGTRDEMVTRFAEKFDMKTDEAERIFSQIQRNDGYECSRKNTSLGTCYSRKE